MKHCKTDTKKLLAADACINDGKTSSQLTDDSNSYSLPSSPTTTTTSPASQQMTHICILYALVCFLAAGLITTACFASYSLQALRRELDTRLSQTELHKLNLLSVHGGRSNLPEHSDKSKQSVDAAILQERELTHNDIGGGPYAVNNVQVADSEIKGGRKETKLGQVIDFGEKEVRSRREATKGSLDEPDDWVWMSSFSRIPVSVLIGWHILLIVLIG